MSQKAGAALTELKAVRRWNPQTGWSTVKSWRGLDAEIQGLAAQMMEEKVEFETEDDEGDYRILRATFTTAEDGSSPQDQIVTRYSLHTSSLEKSLYESRFARLLPEPSLAAVRYAMAALDYTPKDYPGLSAKSNNYDVALAYLTALHAGTSLEGHAAALFKRLVSGKPESFLVSQYVLRGTTTYPRGVKIEKDQRNLDKFYPDTPTLAALEKLPSDLPFTIPTGVWFKHGFQADEQSDGKWVVVEEWLHADAIDDWVYEQATQVS